MLDYILYPTPLETGATLTSDDGVSSVGAPYVHSSGRPGLCLKVNEASINMGATLILTCAGYQEQRFRGILVPGGAGLAYLLIDDITLSPTATPTPTPPTPTDPDWKDPLAVINWVHATGNYDLTNPIGCGLFTEECCRQLHDHNSKFWGHIHKEPGQNQFNEHAVDAIMLLTMAWGIQPGGYDIIKSSMAADACPAFNYVGGPDPSLWYYPAAPIVTDDLGDLITINKAAPGRARRS